MSASSTTVGPELFDYLAARTRDEDDFLRDLKTNAEAEGIPPIWISPEQGSFLQVILKLAKVRRVVEVGTLAGYSAITMARALPDDGRVDTIELEPKHADFAEKWVAKSDVAGKVVVHRGSGSDVMRTLEPDSADAAFIDADKAGYGDYLGEALRIVRVGGLILCDNAFAFGRLLDESSTDESVQAIRDFNDRVASEPRLHGIIMPIGDGCWVGIRES
ncbi:MAG: O-methyltransferase [Acidobacteriota bacterium]